MPKINIFILMLIPILNGCASNSALNKKADNHNKAGDYYESIGQPQAAQRQHRMAQEDRKDASSIEAILFDIIFTSKDDKK